MTLLTGSDMSVIISGQKRKTYSNNSSYSYSGIGPKERALFSNRSAFRLMERMLGCSVLNCLCILSIFVLILAKRVSDRVGGAQRRVIEARVAESKFFVPSMETGPTKDTIWLKAGFCFTRSLFLC